MWKCEEIDVYTYDVFLPQLDVQKAMMKHLTILFGVPPHCDPNAWGFEKARRNGERRSSRAKPSKNRRRTNGHGEFLGRLSSKWTSDTWQEDEEGEDLAAACLESTCLSPHFYVEFTYTWLGG